MAVSTNNAKVEFDKFLKKWAVIDNRYSNGLDVGCGTCRCDDMIPSIDNQNNYLYAHAQYVWDCHDLELFNDDSLDFIFSSHCLEDFPDIPVVFENWWKKIKPNGLMLLLLPDMEICGCSHCCGKSRYPMMQDGGNPSHRTNVGKKYMADMLEDMKQKGLLDYKIEQVDTIPHNESSSVDVVIRKLK
jgi:predicted SAM-dependent methyltransferase